MRVEKRLGADPLNNWWKECNTVYTFRVPVNTMNPHCGFLWVDTMLVARDTMMSKEDIVPALLALPFQRWGRQVREPSQHC